MNNDLKAVIRSTVLQCRKILFTEISEMLQSQYGLLSDGEFEALENLPGLQQNPERLKIHQELRDWLDEEVRSGLTKQQAYQKLLHETAFTHLNRLVAFKMFETRQLIRGTVNKGLDSNGFKHYLVDHEDDLQLYENGQAEDAYRHFLQWQCRQIAEREHLEVLFDPDTLPGKLFPRPKALLQIIDHLNSDDLAPAWQQEETIGWVYQYFIEQDKDAVFEKIYRQKQKMDLRDIPKATQIFTPHWIVQYLVENTLGRLWLRMHPDSRLREKMKYFVHNPYTDNQPLPVKSVQEITLLDPACGTMHFGLVAFDLFYEMYLEELENAGQPGWPEIKDQRLKIKDESEIPVAIVENNLYGIDIDLRAIQLSALTLYLKVKAKNREAHIQKLNLTYTDLPPIPEKEMDVFVNTISLSHPIASELLRKILPELNKAYYLGSLLKIEQVVQDFIREKRRQLEKQPIAAIADYGQQVFESPDGFWQAIKKDILHGLQEMLERQTNGKQRVAGHAIQELGLIDALMKKYDVVVTNPPYAGRRNIVAKLAEELKNNYPINASDLYAAFIQRNSELVSENGFIGMITQQSFMFTSSFKELREYLLKKFSISTLQQFGPKAFEGMGGDKISTCTFVLNKTKNPWEVKGIYFRLTAERFCDKRLAFEKALTNWQDSGEHATDRHIFVVRQEDFKAIPGWPLVYWVSEGMREIFEQNNTIEAISDVALGMTTGDNFRVLRYVWEVGFNKKHYFNYNNKKDYLSRWYLYSKGGDYNKWFGNQDFVINWSNNGQEIKNMSSYPRAQNFYFKEGATYSLSVFPICFRYLPPGFIFDVQGSSLFSERQTIIFFIGFLNSKIISYFLQMLNPTMVYQVGDIARLPYPDVSQYLELVQTIEQKAQTCIHLKRSLVQQEPTSWEYIAPPDWQTGFQERLWKEYRLTVLESEISEMVYRLYEVGEEDIRQIEAEFGPLPTRGINLATDLHRLSQMNEIIDSSETDELKQAIRLIKKYYLEKHIPEEAFKSDEVLAEEAEAGKSSGKSRRQARYLTFEEVCIASGYHPDTVYQIIAEAGWERPEERFALAYNWLEYAIGILMGRFKPGVKGELGSGIIHQNDFVTGSLTINEDEFEEITRFFPTDHTDEQGKHRFTPELAETLRAFVDPDGIMVLDAGHSDDLPGKVEEVLTVMLDEHTAQQIIATLVGDVSGDRQKFRRFLERDFFSKHHLKMYRKRPIYWLLQSAKKNYGFYIFHERIDQDTLYKLQRLYIDPKLNWLQQKLESLHNQWLAADNVEKRRLDRERENIEDLIDEIKEFAQKIDRVIRRQDENGRQVGYAPDINDGVILNMAPLHELIPWNEPAKYWQELDEGRYDWAHIAMRYWPNRVKAKCKTDKSLAIAHGVEGEGKQN